MFQFFRGWRRIQAGTRFRWSVRATFLATTILGAILAGTWLLFELQNQISVVNNTGNPLTMDVELSEDGEKAVATIVNRQEVAPHEICSRGFSPRRKTKIVVRCHAEFGSKSAFILCQFVAPMWGQRINVSINSFSENHTNTQYTIEYSALRRFVNANRKWIPFSKSRL